MVEPSVEPPRAHRFKRALASPTGVFVVVPALVVSVGIGVLLLGLAATRETSDRMARDQLATQAADVAHDLAFALDQAAPMLDRLRALADPALPLAEAATRMHDLHLGRAGVTNVSIGFPTGALRGTYMDGAAVRVQETRDGTRTNYAIDGRTLRTLDTQPTDYDVRRRPHYQFALERGARAWMPPRVYFTSHTTGITCVEPVLADGKLVAVITVDFDVGALSEFVVRAPMVGARSVVLTRDGTILAYPAAAPPEVAVAENRLLSYADYNDPALAALFDAIGTEKIAAQQFITLHAKGRAYLASIAPLAGARAGVPTPLDWYLATFVREAALLGPTQRLQRNSLLASAGALVLALAIAFVFAWNFARMRRLVGAARERARSAEQRATDLGSYRLVEKLGAGGMGEVWRAEHRLLARQAAVKLVRAESLKDPVRAMKLRERFRREAQTLATMRSRHTIALYDYGVADDGTFFYVMELLEGLDLDKYVRMHGAMPAARVIDLLAQACQSLAEAHDAGLLHRDIKPGNLFLTRAADEVDIIKLLDFGIVRSFTERDADPIEAVTLPTPEERMSRAQRLTKHGAVIGTTGYIAPEQTEGKDVDGRSDLYALGCVAWWLLTASEVFARNTDEMETLRAHCEDPLPDLAARVKAWVPTELVTLITELLAKRPDDRPPHARAVATRLRAIPIPTEHVWTEVRAQTWWRMHFAKPPGEPVVEPSAEKRLLVSDRIERPHTG